MGGSGVVTSSVVVSTSVIDALPLESFPETTAEEEVWKFGTVIYVGTRSAVGYAQFVIQKISSAYCSIRFEITSELIENLENLVSELDLLLAGCTGNVVLPTRKVYIKRIKHNVISLEFQRTESFQFCACFIKCST